MLKHGSVNLYVHGNQKAGLDGQPRMSTSTLTQLLNYVNLHAPIYFTFIPCPAFVALCTSCVKSMFYERLTTGNV